MGNGRPSNLFLRLPETGRKLMIGLLGMQDMLRLDTAMVHREGRVALLEVLEAYEGTGGQARDMRSPAIKQRAKRERFS